MNDIFWRHAHLGAIHTHKIKSSVVEHKISLCELLYGFIYLYTEIIF